jgi:hypothetical protein
MAHVGFKALQAKIERQGKSPKAAAAIAATVGRRKFGKEGMARLAAEGKRRAHAAVKGR